MTRLYYFKQFSLASKRSQFSSILPIDRTLSSATTAGHSGPGSDGNEEALRIHQVTGASLSNFVLYPRHLFREFYSSADMQSAYSTAGTEWATKWDSDNHTQL